MYLSNKYYDEEEKQGWTVKLPEWKLKPTKTTNERQRGSWKKKISEEYILKAKCVTKII